MTEALKEKDTFDPIEKTVTVKKIDNDSRDPKTNEPAYRIENDTLVNIWVRECLADRIKYVKRLNPGDKIVYSINPIIPSDVVEVRDMDGNLLYERLP